MRREEIPQLLRGKTREAAYSPPVMSYGWTPVKDSLEQCII
jgi:hypothetical protein